MSSKSNEVILTFGPRGLISCSFLKSNTQLRLCVITHAYGSHVSIAIMRLCLSVCPRDKTKTAETKIVKLGTQMVHHDTSPTNEY